MTHFIDENGNIPKEMPAEARELASFFGLVIDFTTDILPTIITKTELRCFKKKCKGTVIVEFLPDDDRIHWLCSKCFNEGLISDWQGTKWDNREAETP